MCYRSIDKSKIIMNQRQLDSSLKPFIIHAHFATIPFSRLINVTCMNEVFSVRAQKNSLTASYQTW